MLWPHSDDNLIPRYGSFMCNKLIRLSTSWSGKISCGGIVSLFAKSTPVRAPYPEIHEPLPDETYLTPGILMSMIMFRVEDGNHIWTVGQNHDPQLLITPKNRDILALRGPNNFTDWKITPYLFPDSFSKEEDGDSDESGGAAPQNYPPMGGASSSHQAGHPSYHQQYMDQFQSIHILLDTYYQDLMNLTQSFSSFTTQYTRDQERQPKHEEVFWAWTRNSDYYPYPPPPPPQ
ncbi:unnamed protein product [Lactuca saligna]|uniref:Uncharacterized protein n=1 Tax=Lactuca saligna TaxID=75948 RepID=A0AA35YDH6_LACSI|nr:unnamed protein product [Lactuca saligna]